MVMQRVTETDRGWKEEGLEKKRGKRGRQRERESE